MGVSTKRVNKGPEDRILTDLQDRIGRIERKLFPRSVGGGSQVTGADTAIQFASSSIRLKLVTPSQITYIASASGLPAGVFVTVNVKQRAIDDDQLYLAVTPGPIETDIYGEAEYEFTVDRESEDTYLVAEWKLRGLGVTASKVDIVPQNDFPSINGTPDLDDTADPDYHEIAVVVDNPTVGYIVGVRVVSSGSIKPGWDVVFDQNWGVGSNDWVASFGWIMGNDSEHEWKDQDGELKDQVTYYFGVGAAGYDPVTDDVEVYIQLFSNALEIESVTANETFS